MSAAGISARSKNRGLTPILGFCAWGLTPILVACAAMDGELNAARDSWRGATYDQVLMAWGTPSSSGNDWHTWLTYDSPPPQAERSGGGAGGVIFGAPGTVRDVTPRCDRTLAFRDGRVVDANWVGDAEFCKRFARRTR
jgi:hypothetical protein